ncbi:MAG: tetratricopeptide repeat protein [Candidatus Omnitrophota bacterium]
MNRKLIIILIAALVITGFSTAGIQAAAQRKTPAYGMFYKANELFREKNYDQAVEQYQQILALGIESGNLYYNMGNAYFKAGMLGKALSKYEQAKRLIPNDSDLKANINFLESLRESPVMASRRVWIISMLEYFGNHFSMDALTLIWVYIYWILLIISSAAVLLPYSRAILKNYIISGGIILLLISCIWAVKFYDLHKNTYAFVIDEVIDAKFAPEEEATTYFKVYEGTRVAVIREEGKWARIKTPDGKIGWASRLGLDKI